MMYIKFFTLAIIIIFQLNAAASTKLAFPLDCVLGESCWIANLPRHHVNGKQLDFRCGPNTYDGHKGTDIALKDLLTHQLNTRLMQRIAHPLPEIIS